MANSTQRHKSKHTAEKPCIGKTDTWTALADALRMSEAIKPKGEGWLTAKYAAQRLGVAQTYFYRTIKPLVASGKMEVFRGRKSRERGRKGSAIEVWYRPKP